MARFTYFIREQITWRGDTDSSATDGERYAYEVFQTFGREE